MKNVAVYITTTPYDYYLAKALVQSVRHHCPQVSLYLLPDDSYKGSHLFGCPVWRPSEVEVRELDGYYKKLRAFWGPAEKFIFLDADILLLKDPAPLLAEVAGRNEPFLMVCAETKWRQIWSNASEEKKRSHFEQWVGDIRLIGQFDGRYDWRRELPFNSGFIAAHREVFDRAALMSTFRSARSFHGGTNPERGLTTSRKGLFMTDQGFLNYFVAKAGVEAERLDDVFLWGGDKELWRQRASLPGPYAGLLIHWAGCPRPGLLRRGISGGAEWKHFYLQYCRSHSDYRGLIRDLCEERVRSFKDWGSKVKRSILRRASTQ